jgi:hypothetical protein
MAPVTKILALIMLTLVCPAVATEIPDPPELTEDEEARLADGKLVVHKGLDGTPWKVLGVIEIDAAPTTVWDQILDMDTRVEDNKSAKSYEVYGDTTEGGLRHLYVTMTLQVVGRPIVYYNHYRIDAAGSYMWFTLDEDKESDLKRCDGSYHVIPSPQNEGGSRLIYVLDTEPATSLPETLRVLMATKGLKAMLTSVKARAEGG